jgi:tRNA(Ile)-lysidine synthase
MDGALSAERRERFAASLDALAPAGRLGIAVSGGPDSLALLLLANAARPGEIAAATVDHGLRAEAAAEAAMVAALCGRLSIPHETLRVTVADDPAGVQAAARHARYAALTAWAAQEGLPFLATAHHADDQAETVLMRLARGAGLAGLSGIRERRPLADGSATLLVRPLLDWTKAELETIVAEAGLAPARDPSNSDERYDRTRARVLLAGGWPEAGRVAASAHHLAEAEAALSWTAARLAEERLSVMDDAATIDGCDLPRELRRRLLLIAFAALTPGTEYRGDSVDRLLHALDRGRVATLAGFRCDPGPPWRVSRAAARRGSDTSQNRLE